MTEKGWYCESNPKYADILVKMFGLEGENVNAAPTPGDASVTEFEGADTKLGPDKHAEYRSGGGVVHYHSGDRLDCKFSARMIIRDGAAPTRGSWAKLKRHARYLAGKKRYVNWYPWQKRQSVMRT